MEVETVEALCDRINNLPEEEDIPATENKEIVDAIESETKTLVNQTKKK